MLTPKLSAIKLKMNLGNITSNFQDKQQLNKALFSEAISTENFFISVAPTNARLALQFMLAGQLVEREFNP